MTCGLVSYSKLKALFAGLSRFMGPQPDLDLLMDFGEPSDTPYWSCEYVGCILLEKIRSVPKALVGCSSSELGQTGARDGMLLQVYRTRGEMISLTLGCLFLDIMI